MAKLITHNSNALRFLMTEDIYDLGDDYLTSEAGGRKAEDGGRTSEEPGTVSEIQVAASMKEAVNIKQAERTVDFNYLGENNRYFLILVDDVTHNELNASHKDLLLKIMAAKNLGLRDLAILNIAKYPQANFGHLKEFFSCSKIALFGIDPHRIGLPEISANIVEKYADVKLLATFGLEEMRTNIDKKREFWNVMKDF